MSISSNLAGEQFRSCWADVAARPSRARSQECDERRRRPCGRMVGGPKAACDNSRNSGAPSCIGSGCSVSPGRP